MKEIGFKNFRRFADEVSIPLGAINLFVGGNNSGKSTVVKAILLTISNLNSFSFRSQFPKDFEDKNSLDFNFAPARYHDILHIGTFQRAVNTTHPENNIVFKSKFENFEIVVIVTNPQNTELPTAEVQQININYNANELVYFLDFIKREATISIKIERILLHLKDYLSRSIRFLCLSEKSLEALPNIEEELNTSNFILYLEGLLDLINNKYKDKLYDSENLRWARIPRIIERLKIQKDFLLINKEESTFQVNVTFDNFYNNLNTDLPFVDSREKQSPSSYEIREDIIPNLFESHDDSILTLLSSLFKDVKEELYKTLEFQQIEYIYAHAVSQKTLYPINSKQDYMAQTIESYFRTNIKSTSKEHKWIKMWMQKFKIAEDFEVTPIAGCEAYTVKIGDENTPTSEWQYLAEKGMGSIQIMVLLLKVATLISQHKIHMRRMWAKRFFTIIVEEPEQNLHPSMQALLADFFFETNRRFNIQFVVETHSEYLIRRAQVLAGGIVSSSEDDFQKKNPFNIFYFPEIGKPYRMGMYSSGHFKNNFNEGFFDVAAKLNMEVSRREQKRDKLC